MPRYICPRCQHSFRDKTALRYHLEGPRACLNPKHDIPRTKILNGMGVQPQMYSCIRCSKLYRSRNQIQRHEMLCQQSFEELKSKHTDEICEKFQVLPTGDGPHPVLARIGDVEIPTTTNKPGVYLMAVGIYQDKVIGKFGCTVNFSDRAAANCAHFAKLRDVDFKYAPVILFWRDTDQQYELEEAIKGAVSAQHCYKGKGFKIGGASHDELFELKDEVDKQRLLEGVQRVFDYLPSP